MFIVYESINPKKQIVPMIFGFIEIVVFSVAIFLRIVCYMTCVNNIDVQKDDF